MSEEDFYKELEQDMKTSDEENLSNSWWWFWVMSVFLFVLFVLTVMYFMYVAIRRKQTSAKEVVASNDVAVASEVSLP